MIAAPLSAGAANATVARPSPAVAATPDGAPGAAGTGGGGPPAWTRPVMKSCRPQWKSYVPGVSNRQVPVQPSAVGMAGSGGTAPELAPAVCVHDVGATASKITLWALPPSG